MTSEENQDCQDRLEKLLQTLMEAELSQEDDFSSKIDELKGIYLDNNGEQNGFRHQYSRISSCILDFQASNAPGYLNDPAQILANNLAVIKDEIRKDESTQLSIPVAKLYDHVNLELLRINYNARLNEEQDEKLNRLLIEIRSQNENLKATKRNVSSKLDEVKDKLSAAQKESVAILAIFAAVVMAFTGGFSFIANSFSGLTSTPIEKILCLVLLVGLILINLFYALLKFVWCIIKKKEESSKIPFSVTTLAVINIAFGFLSVLFFVVSCLNNT